jgi:hypothetical protein
MGDDEYALLDGLLDVLLSCVKFFLKQLDLALKALASGLRCLALYLALLQVGDLALELFIVRFQNGKPVLKRSDLLLLLQEGLLVLFVLGLSLFSPDNRGIGLGTKRSEFLSQGGKIDGAMERSEHASRILSICV